MTASDALVQGAEVPAKNGHSIESGHAKFTKNEENVDINAKTKLISLTKEQLEPYRNDPFWKPVRYSLFILFWLVWVTLFVGAVLIVALSPKCNKLGDEIKQKWFENTINYQVYTPTFYDSDGDGVGDLKGIEEKLEYLRRIGVKSIRPTPLLATAKDDFSPAQVVDVLAIDERFGTADDLKSLTDTAHSKAINVIADIPLTVRAEKKESPYLLNVEDKQVQARLVEAASKLLRLGVDGIHFADYGYAKKSPIKSLDPIIRKIRELAATDETIKQKELLVIVEAAWKSSTTLADYHVQPLLNDDDKNVLDHLAENIIGSVHEIRTNFTNAPKPIWKYADLDSPRLDQQIDLDPIISPHTEETVALLSVIQLFLPGPISVYYGEEFGLRSIKPALPSQFPQRGLMRWNAEQANSGFSNVSGSNFFGDLSAGFSEVAFEPQYANQTSQLRAFKRIADLRKRNWVLQTGDLGFRKDGLHLYSRYRPNDSSSEIFVLAVNWPIDGRASAQKLQLAADFVQNRALTSVEVKATSPNASRHWNRMWNLEKEELVLEPYEAVILRIP